MAQKTVCSNNSEELNVGTGMPRGEFSSVFCGKPSSDEECKKILSEYPERAHYEEENAEGPIKRLLSAVDLNGPSGFLRMYAEYRVALESATKVVKEFLIQK